MQMIFLFGGLLGFLLVLTTGLLGGREITPVLRDAAFACLGTAILFRWFWGVVQSSFRQTARDFRARAIAKLAAEEAASADGKSADVSKMRSQRASAPPELTRAH